MRENTIKPLTPLLIALLCVGCHLKIEGERAVLDAQALDEDMGHLYDADPHMDSFTRDRGSPHDDDRGPIQDTGVSDLEVDDADLPSQEIINVIEAGAQCDGTADDTNTLRQVIADAPAYSTLLFPSSIPNFCRLTGHLTIDKPVHIRGEEGARLKRTDHYPDGSDESPSTQCADPGYTCEAPCNQNCGGAIFYVIHSDVTIEGLEITGHDYGSARVGNTHGIWVIGASNEPADWLSNITIRDNRLHAFRGSGISLVRVTDFIIENNDIEDVGYSGINIVGRRGRVAENRVRDLNHPEFCPQYPELSGCQFLNSYGIVVTGCGSNPCSEDIILNDNEVRENEHWVGMMNHGGQRILFRRMIASSFSIASVRMVLGKRSLSDPQTIQCGLLPRQETLIG
jgi:hypothetical protein